MLNGPVTLHLSSSRVGRRHGLRLPLRLHRRAAAARRSPSGTLSGEHLERPRSRWGQHDISVGTVESHPALPATSLRTRACYVGHGDQWVAMTSSSAQQPRALGSVAPPLTPPPDWPVSQNPRSVRDAAHDPLRGRARRHLLPGDDDPRGGRHRGRARAGTRAAGRARAARRGDARALRPRVRDGAARSWRPRRSPCRAATPSARSRSAAGRSAICRPAARRSSPTASAGAAAGSTPITSRSSR